MVVKRKGLPGQRGLVAAWANGEEAMNSVVLYWGCAYVLFERRLLIHA